MAGLMARGAKGDEQPVVIVPGMLEHAVYLETVVLPVMHLQSRSTFAVAALVVVAAQDCVSFHFPLGALQEIPVVRVHGWLVIESDASIQPMCAKYLHTF